MDTGGIRQFECGNQWTQLVLDNFIEGDNGHS